ncbi:hypothetical protein PIB30_011373 [Stylosanthes scabra]|uniref:Uncharacterized protein n=1 Tax=Stylosanthes scabra TaxID=79078 RepID=A0ABU6Y4J6_9FABA|nr:hypothetical protein [Stylosanthes scabra]
MSQIDYTPPKRNLRYIRNQPAVWQRTHNTEFESHWSRCCLEFVIQPPAPKRNPLSLVQSCCHQDLLRVRPAVTRFPRTCATLPWRTSYGQGTATMLARAYSFTGLTRSSSMIFMEICSFGHLHISPHSRHTIGLYSLIAEIIKDRK